MTRLEPLKKYPIVVADTGDIDSIAKHKPQDATTNPSLLYAAAQQPSYQHLVEDAANFAQKENGEKAQAEAFMDKLFVSFGIEILKLIPARVSTEVDAGLSFDTERSVAKAPKLIGLYEQAGVNRQLLLIKVASTWEGIRAAERLTLERSH